LTKCSKTLRSKASASLAFESQRKIVHHKELYLGCSVTITNGANTYIRLCPWFPGNCKMLQFFVRELQWLQTSDQVQKLVVNVCEVSATKN